MLFTSPSIGAARGFCIFMASNMTTCCPAFTLSPTLQVTSTMRPGMGAVTEPAPAFPAGAAGAAAAAGFGAAGAAALGGGAAAGFGAAGAAAGFGGAATGVTTGAAII